MNSWINILLCFGLLSASAGPKPLGGSRWHAHNDYRQTRPLFDALDHGCASVEADVWLVDGELLVGHDLFETQSHRTLKSLYLEPLLTRIRSKEPAQKLPEGFTLLIDVKSEAESTYMALQPLLHEYRGMLTLFTGEEIKTGAVTVILSGNRPRQTLKKQPIRYAAMDGRLVDLQSSEPSSLMPWISDNWKAHFKWNGLGSIPANERKKLEEMVRQAHQASRQLRFWNTPELPAVWNELKAAGVDWINVDTFP